jgi:hypothetical protein
MVPRWRLMYPCAQPAPRSTVHANAPGCRSGLACNLSAIAGIVLGVLTFTGMPRGSAPIASPCTPRTRLFTARSSLPRRRSQRASAAQKVRCARTALCVDASPMLTRLHPAERIVFCALVIVLFAATEAVGQASRVHAGPLHAHQFGAPHIPDTRILRPAVREEMTSDDRHAPPLLALAEFAQWRCPARTSRSCSKPAR